VTAAPLVIAIGQSWNDLAIETRVLDPDGIRIVDGRKLPPDDPLWAEASGVLLGTAQKLDAARLQHLTGCRAIVRYGIGYDNVDIGAAETLGIAVAIVRDYCIEEVAEHALAMALALARALPQWDAATRSGAWRGGAKPVLRKFSTLTFALLGFGLIGRTVAEKARHLFGRVMVYDPMIKPADADLAPGVTFTDDLQALLAEADVLSVHVPLTETTRGLVDAAALARMKPSSVVINVSRGGIIDEGALLRAVRDGTIAGAGLDTFTVEPLPRDHPLLGEPRILLSPHVAWLSQDSEVRLRERASEEIAHLLRGRPASALVSKGNARLRQAS
jgi:D-3-phosphoglycerate dehydrogenase